MKRREQLFHLLYLYRTCSFLPHLCVKDHLDICLENIKQKAICVNKVVHRWHHKQNRSVTWLDHLIFYMKAFAKATYIATLLNHSFQYSYCGIKAQNYGLYLIYIFLYINQYFCLAKLIEQLKNSSRLYGSNISWKGNVQLWHFMSFIQLSVKRDER